jgi:hypothetical protein
VIVGALFKPGYFSFYAAQCVLVLCDVEGAERDLLSLELAPALAGMDLIVRSYEYLTPRLTKLLAVWEWRFGPAPWLVMKTKNKI